MGSVKISQLPEASILTSDDIIDIVQDTGNKKIDLNSLGSFLGGKNFIKSTEEPPVKYSSTSEKLEEYSIGKLYVHEKKDEEDNDDFYILKDITSLGKNDLGEYEWDLKWGHFSGATYNIENGESSGSIQSINKEDEEKNSVAIGENSLALGENNVAGCKGYYIKSIDTTNKKIYLTNTQVVPVISTIDNTDDTFETPAYELGETGVEFATVNNFHYNFIGSIMTSISNNVVSYTGNLGYSEIKEDGLEPWAYIFFVPTQPQIGTVSFSSSSIASGSNTIAAGSYSHTEGYGTIVAGNYGHAEGNSTRAGASAHAEGQLTIASGHESHAEGYSTTAKGGHSHAEGSSTSANGASSHSEGTNTEATGNSAHAEGNITIAKGNYSHSEGGNTEANGNWSHSEGYYSISKGVAAHAEGRSSANGSYSHSEGYNTNALNEASHAEGYKTTASGKSSHAEGRDTQAIGDFSHVEGRETKTIGANSHASGYRTIAGCKGYHIRGIDADNKKIYLSSVYPTTETIPTISTTDYTDTSFETPGYNVGEGFSLITASHYHFTGLKIVSIKNNVVTFSGTLPFTEIPVVSLNRSWRYTFFVPAQPEIGAVTFTFSSHAEGENTKALGAYSHAEGEFTIAVGNYSHAEGEETKAGVNAHAEGRATVATGEYSHAEGAGSRALGGCSHAEGNWTVASGDSQHVQGKFNKDSGSNYAHIVGNGTSVSNRSNAHTLDWEGNAWFAGNISAGVNATSFDKNSMALGMGVISSCKGYYYKSIDINSKKIYLSTTQANPPVISTVDNTDTSFSTPAYTVGDEIGIVNSTIYVFHGVTIKSISNNVIVYDGDLPFDTIDEATVAVGAKQWSYSVFVPKKPTIGSIVLTKGAFAEGGDTKAVGAYSHAEGYGTIAAGQSAHAEGRDTKAGSNAHAEGQDTIARGGNSHAEGAMTLASGTGSHAEGYGTKAMGQQSHAEGEGTKSVGRVSHTEGLNTTAEGMAAHAEGSQTIANGMYSHAEGEGGDALGKGSHAEGRGTVAEGEGSHAEGYSTDATGTASHSEGGDTKASGDYSHAEGFNAKATSLRAHAEGLNTTASGINSHAEGNGTYAEGANSHAEGHSTVSKGAISHAEGRGTITSEEAQHVQGKFNKEVTGYAHVIGAGSEDSNRKNIHSVKWDGTAYFANKVYVGAGDGSDQTLLKELATQEYVQELVSSGEGTTSIDINLENGTGENSLQQSLDAETWTSINEHMLEHLESKNYTTEDGAVVQRTEDGSFVVGAFGINSTMMNGKSQTVGGKTHAEGSKTLAFENNAHAEGNDTYAGGKHSHAEGNETAATGNSAHAEGIGSLASANYSHAEGNDTRALGENSHAEGYLTTALGDASHAEGGWTRTLKSYSHAEGLETTANGNQSHAEGMGARTNSVGSHAEGYWTIASGEYQHVQGKSNIEDTENKYAHIVGNGDDTIRSNAHTLDWSGNAWFAGEVIVGENNEKLATENMVSSKIAEIVNSAPETLNTLNELAEALGDDPNFATTITEELSNTVHKTGDEEISGYKTFSDGIETEYIYGNELRIVGGTMRIDSDSGMQFFNDSASAPMVIHSGDDYIQMGYTSFGKYGNMEIYAQETLDIDCKEIDLKSNSLSVITNGGETVVEGDAMQIDLGGGFVVNTETGITLNSPYQPISLNGKTICLISNTPDGEPKATINDEEIATVPYVDEVVGVKANAVDVYTKEEVDSKLGDIETALDSILAMQEALIGGDNA